MAAMAVPDGQAPARLVLTRQQLAWPVGLRQQNCPRSGDRREVVYPLRNWPGNTERGPGMTPQAE